MTSLEYPKTENLFARDPETHQLIVGEFRMPEVELVDSWHVTEKIDGTNIRAIYFPSDKLLEVRGRSDRANLPPGLEDHVRELFPLEKLAATFDEFIGAERALRGAHVTFYGEGYGPGIQKGGGDYAPVKLFRVFDIAYHWPFDGKLVTEGYKTSWCQPSTTEWICDSLGAPRVPLLGRRLTTDEVISLVCNRMNYSETAREDGDRPDVLAEGVIARTDPYLYTVQGSRVMFKLKHVDIEKGFA